MIDRDNILSRLKLCRYLWCICSICKKTINKFVLFRLSLSHKYEQLPYLRSCSNPNENPIFFFNIKRGEGWEIIRGLMITPILIVDIHTFKDKKLFKMPTNICFTDQKRLICFEMPVDLKFLWGLYFLPDWIIQWVFAVPARNLALAD